MRTSLLALVCSALLTAAAFAAQPAGSWLDVKPPPNGPEDVPAAHTVALSALNDATAVEVEGPLYGGIRKDFTPIVINAHFTIKRAQTIRDLRSLLVRAKFHRGTIPPGGDGALSGIFFVRFVVTTTKGGKIPFFVFEGEELRIDGLQTSVADHDIIFESLHKLLLRAEPK